MTLLERKALEWRRGRRLQIAAEGCSRLAAAAGLGLPLLLWSDQLLALPQGARWAAWSAGLAVLAAGAAIWIVKPLLALSWGQVLDGAARAYPEAAQHLKPAWELAGARPIEGISDALRAEHLARTEALLSGLPERRVFPVRVSRGAFRALSSGAALCVLSGFFLSGSPSWERVLRPWRDVALERFLSVFPGDAELELGKPAQIAVRWAASSPVAKDRKSLRLWVRGPSGWKAQAWDSASPEEAGFVVQELVSSLDYRLTWRDLRSRAYRLKPVTAPELESVRVKVHGPEPLITSLNAAEPLSVVRGSWVTITGTPNQALASAAMRLSSLPPIAMKRLADGDLEASFLVREDASLTFDLEAVGGRRDPHPAVYAVRALADNPPQVELLSPAAAIQASPLDSIPITYAARDDGGLVRSALIVRPAGRPAQERELERLGGRREFTGDALLDLSAFPMGRLEFQVKVYDNASPSQTGLSATGVVEIVDLEGTHGRMESQWLKTEEALKALEESEESARKLAASARAQELSAEQAALEARWKPAVSQMQELSRQMDSDALANPGLADEAKAAAEALARAQSRDLAAAAQAARAGDMAAAEKAHARLGREVEKARRLLSEGRKVQGLQDFYSQAGRMSQSAASLESSLESASGPKGRSVSAEEARKLAATLEKVKKQLEQLQETIAKLPKADPSGKEAKLRKAYSLPVQSALQTASQLAKALSSGDYASAAEAARRLSESLAEIQQGLEQAALDAASDVESQASQKTERAQALWSEVIEDQTRAMEATQRLEDERLQKTLEAQRALLAQLEKDQSVLVSSAQAPGSRVPSDAVAAMDAALKEFSSRKIVRAAPQLRSASARLRAEAAARAIPSLSSMADAEDDVRARLEQGAQAPAAPSAGSAQAAALQAAVRAKTGRLQSELEELDEQAASVPQEALDRVKQAQAEQQGAEGELSDGRTPQALGRQQAALSLLTEGASQLGAAAGGRKASAAAMGRPFQRPGPGAPSAPGGRGSTGAQVGFVPLPSAKDYRPAPQIRQELERSLREPRPPAYDGVIKEYFKRITQ